MIAECARPTVRTARPACSQENGRKSRKQAGAQRRTRDCNQNSMGPQRREGDPTTNHVCSQQQKHEPTPGCVPLEGSESDGNNAAAVWRHFDGITSGKSDTVLVQATTSSVANGVPSREGGLPQVRSA